MARRPFRKKVTVVSITIGAKFRVDATINKENMLQRIHTWVPDPVLGDMNYERVHQRKLHRYRR